MKKMIKRIVGWGSGAGISISFVAVAFVLIFTLSSGSMTNLHGGNLVDVTDITPHAGGDDSYTLEGESCGSYMQWIGNKADESAFKKTGREYRVLPPNSFMSLDHNPERINIHIDEDNIIEDVKCG